ncbi:unnamed protein product [Mytilus coruscus]|uniref:Uncharacterized protein n=1 Tax=Mytilus coruscus TaxID=42192 RepID=A0A6J8EMZ8_MYTCO|nr:unnamed protein product [Mytilus coruscus]
MHYQTVCQESLRHSHSYLVDSLKDRPCMIGKPATDLLIDEVWSSLEPVDEKITKDDTTSKSLSGKKNYQEFLNHCTVRRQYFFMIKKCGKADCNICRPVRGPWGQEAFNEVHFLPDPVPMPTDPDHYQKFSELYGKNTSEEHRPSLQQKKASIGSVAKDKGIRISGETVRAVLRCEDCNKPRCVHANRKLNKDQLILLQGLEEDISYICGMDFFPDDHPLQKICCVLAGIHCATEVSAHFYSSRLKFRPVCYVCGIDSSKRHFCGGKKFVSIRPPSVHKLF